MDFPFARFTSLLGVHTVLTIFSALYLPRTSYLGSVPPEQSSSRDKPQHPFLVPITADPALTLAWLVVGSVVLQGWWGGWMKVWWKEALQAKLGPLQEQTQKLENVETNAQRLKAFWDAWVATLASSILFYTIIILLGAPIFTHFLQTYLLALLLSCLMVYAPAYSLGTPSLANESNALVHRLTWIRIFAEVSFRQPFERVLAYPVFGAAIGAWLGAIPIALDWDRPWQAWPLTPAYGSITGYILGGWSALAIESTLYLAEAGRKMSAEAPDAPELSKPAAASTASRSSTHRSKHKKRA